MRPEVEQKLKKKAGDAKISESHVSNEQSQFSIEETLFSIGQSQFGVEEKTSREFMSGLRIIYIRELYIFYKELAAKLLKERP